MRNILIIFLTLFSTGTSATGLCDFPVPDYQIDETQTTGIDKAAYDRVLNEVQHTYEPIFSAMGYSLKIHRSWSNGTVNAQAWWTGSTCNIEMFGGFARYRGITSAAIRQIALHEIGHCIGGAPYYSRSNMSVEGQADYYTTAVGCRLLRVGCRNSSLNLAQALASLSRDRVPWRPGPKLREVDRTLQSHPGAQCRLNTYDAGRIGEPRPRCWFKP